MGWLVGGASNTGGEALKQHFSADELAALSERIDPDTVSSLEYYPLPKQGERFPISDSTKQPVMTPRPKDDAEFLHGATKHWVFAFFSQAVVDTSLLRGSVLLLVPQCWHLFSLRRWCPSKRHTHSSMVQSRPFIPMLFAWITLAGHDATSISEVPIMRAGQNVMIWRAAGTVPPNLQACWKASQG
jgi:hypothetical protein